MGRDAVTFDTGDVRHPGTCPTAPGRAPPPARDHTGSSMADGCDVDRVVLDGYESRDLASKIIAAGELLDHEDIGDEQRPAILGALVRAARSLATRVVTADAADDVPVDHHPSR